MRLSALVQRNTAKDSWIYRHRVLIGARMHRT